MKCFRIAFGALALTVAAALPVEGQATLQNGVTACEEGVYLSAFRVLHPLAQAGDDEAQYYLATIYGFARGVTHDAVEAVLWYRRAAEQGHAQAQYNLASHYEEGRGVDRMPGPRWPHLNRVDEEVERAILEHGLERPSHGARPVPDEFLVKGVQVSSGAVRGVA